MLRLDPRHHFFLSALRPMLALHVSSQPLRCHVPGACRDGRFERFWRAQAKSAYRGKARVHKAPRGAGVDVVRQEKAVAETFETAMFIATSRTRLEALRTTCARRARQPGTERAPAASPASQTPPAPPRSPSAELKSALGPITDASSGARGDRVLRGDGWGRGRWGRQGGAEQGAAGSAVVSTHQVVIMMRYAEQ